MHSSGSLLRRQGSISASLCTLAEVRGRQPGLCMQIRPSEGMKEVEIAWLNGSKERKLLLLSFLKNALLLDFWPWSIHKKHDIDRFLSTFQILQDFKTKLRLEEESSCGPFICWVRAV